MDVVADASVALKWFHDLGEEGVGPSRALLDRYVVHEVRLSVLDLTAYEIGNALLRGRAKAGPDRVASVLEALAAICPRISPTASELREAARLADRHHLTMYDAAYAAVAVGRGARLATFDTAILAAGLGSSPEDIIGDLNAGDG